MSSIVKFFVATRASAGAVLEGGPGVSPSVLHFGNFDAEEAVLDWEAHLTGRSFEELVDQGLPEVVAEVEAGPTVFRLSDGLVAALLSTRPAEVDELAQWWADGGEGEGVKIEVAIASDILRQLAALVRFGWKSGEHVYCWIS